VSTFIRRFSGGNTLRPDAVFMAISPPIRNGLHVFEQTLQENFFEVTKTIITAPRSGDIMNFYLARRPGRFSDRTADLEAQLSRLNVS
jgi:hypothetical protein